MLSSGVCVALQNLETKILKRRAIQNSVAPHGVSMLPPEAGAFIVND